MRKHLQKLLLLAALSAVPWVTQGQGFNYTCNFDSDSDTAGWVFVNGSQVNQWFIGTATHNSGTKSLYISNNNGTSNAYTTSSITFVYAYQEFTLDAGGYAISYDWKANGEGNYDYIRVFLAPSSLSLTAGQDPSGGTSAYNWRNAAFPTGCIGLCGADKLNQQTSWQNFFTDFTVPTAGTYRLVFAWANDGSGGTTPPGAIDNIVFLQPTCPRPDNMQFANITPTSFDFSWTESGTATSWIIDIDSAGTSVLTDVVYDTFYSAIGLAGNNMYTVRVAALCDGTDTSMWLSTDFRTPCSFIASLPYQNGFENDPYYSAVPYAQAFPYCWTRINDATGTYNYYPYITTTANYVHSGSKGMYWYFSTTSGYANNEYAVLPGIDTTVYNISDLTLAFYAKTTSSSYHPAPIVGVMTNPNDASTFTPVYTFSNTEITTDWVMYEISFADFTGYGNYIAIKCPRPSSTAYLGIDDVYLTDDWCDIPLDVTANPGTDEVTLSWNPNGGSSFTVILGTDTVVNLMDSTYTFTNLTPNTLYSYSVATECATANSPFVNGSVRTQCVVLDSLPYVQTFESESSGSSTTGSVFVNCWTRLNNGSSSGGYPYVSASTSYNHTPGGTKGLYWYNTTTAGTYGDYQCAVLPSVDTDLFPINTLQLRFWAKASSSSYHPVFYVGVMDNPTDINSFQPVDTINVSGTTWEEYTTLFDQFEGYGQFIAVKAVRPSSSWYAYVDDFVLEPIPNCPAPQDLVATSVTNPDSISFAWTEMGEATEWMIVAVAQGGNPDTCTTGMIVYDDSTSMQLLSGVAYDVYVRSICGANDSSSWEGPVTVIPGLYLMGASGSDTLRTCSAVICDDGGPNGPYGMSEDFTLYVLPGSADSILSISGTSYTEGTYDYIRIYDGLGTGGTQVWNDYGVSSTQNFGPFTSLEGAFTIVWHSDGSVVYDGFQINVHCLGQPSCPAPSNFNLTFSSVDTVSVAWSDTASTGSYELCYGPAGMDPDTVVDNIITVLDTVYNFTNLTAGTTYDLFVRSDCGTEQSWWIGPITVNPGSYFMPATGTDSIRACVVNVFDDGGPLGDYSNNANSTLVIRAPHPDSLFAFSGTAYTESTLDRLVIYDGEGTSGTVLWQTSSSTVHETIPLTVSSGSVVTLSWHTDVSVVYDGFEVNFNCQSAPNCNSISELNVSQVAGTSALLDWTVGSGNTGGDPAYYNVTVNGVTDTTSQNPYWLTGLTPGTHYTVTVQGVCATEGSSFSLSQDFVTTCLAGGDLEISGGTGSNVFYPLNAQVNYSYTQEIYNASQLSGPMTVTGISYRTQANGCSSRNISVYLAETSQGVFHSVSDFIPDSLLHLVYTGSFSGAATTWVPIYFDSAFSYSGMGNLVVALYDHTGSTGTANFQTRSGGDTASLHFHNSTAINLASPSGSTQRATTVQNDIRFLSACDTTATCVAPNVAVFYTTPYEAYVSWAPGLHETSWTVSHRVNGSATWTTDTVGIGTTTYLVPGLLPNTEYVFRVTGICTDTTLDGIASARTACAPTTALPITETFESAPTSSSTNASFVSCWTRLNNGTTYFGYPYVSGSSTYNHTPGGTKGLYWYNTTTTGSYGDYQIVAMPEVDSTIAISGLQLSFWAKDSSSSYTPVFHVGVMTDPNDPSTFVSLDTVTIAGNTNWAQFEIPLAGYTGDGHFVAVRALRPGSSWYAYVDDFELDYIPTCPASRNVHSTATTTTTATIDWTDYSTPFAWEISYTGNGITNTTTVMAHPATITGLTPATSYQFRVRPICGATDTGRWSEPGNVATSCDLIVPPYVQDFNAVTGTAYSTAGELPPCWEGYSNGTSTSYMPHVTDGSTYSYSISGNALTLTSGSATYGDVKFVRLPQFTTPVNTLTMSYWFCTESSTNGTLTVGYMTGPNFTTDFVPVTSHAASSASLHSGNGAQPAGTGVYDTVSFENVPDSALYVAFKWVYTTSYYSCCIDNIEVTSSGAFCAAPAITSVTSDYHSATMTWTGTGTNYEVNIKESVAPNWPDSNIAVTGNSYTFNGLMPSTNYMVRVRQDCTADSIGYSEWTVSGVLTDSLPCLAPDSLHATAVTNATATFDWNVNGNENVWDIHVWYGSFDSTYRTILRPATVGGFTAGLTYNAAIRAVCGVDMLEGDWSDTVQFTTAVCPDITGLATSNVTTNSVTLNWNSNPMALRWNIEYGPTGFTQGQGTQAVSNTNSYVVTGLSDGITYDFYVKAVCGDNWTSENWVGTSATTQEGTIPCDAPTGVSTAVADNSVTVNWTAGTGNISFELEYGPRGFSHGAGSTTTATGSPAVIANLDYETQYDVYVRAVCQQNIFSPWSTVATFTTGERPSEDCDPVQNLTVTNVTETSADVSWQPGASGEGWQVELTDETGSTVRDNVTSETHISLTGLVNCKNYTVKVRTVCEDNNFSAYVTASFRTLGCEGIEEVEGINCRIFPNPATSSTTISVTGVNGMVRIAVVDMNGRTVATETLECSADCEKTMEVDKLAQGAYFVRITAENTNMVKKLIVR